MEISFDYSADRQFYAVQFRASVNDSVPFIRELRFWGVDRLPCPQLSTLAALIVLKSHAVKSVTLFGSELSPPVCTALSQQFGVEIHCAKYDTNRRNLAGGEKIVAPVRFKATVDQQAIIDRTEVLTWISLDDLHGPFGGQIRTNVDVFDLTEGEKNLIVGLCCAGKDVGHLVLKESETGFGRVLHRIGLELVDASDAV